MVKVIVKKLWKCKCNDCFQTRDDLVYHVAKSKHLKNNNHSFDCHCFECVYEGSKASN